MTFVVSVCDQQLLVDRCGGVVDRHDAGIVEQ
jgi:hypothetical protein